MQQDRHESGCTFQLDAISGAPCIEAELCLRMSETLRGPGLTADYVRPHVAGMSPAFEILSIPVQSGRDAPSIIAANVFQ